VPEIHLFLLASALLTLAPGPDNLQVLARGIAEGRRAALAAACGFASGVLFHTALAVAGIALLIRSSPTLFAALKYAGAAYLAYLGVLALTRRETGPASRETAATLARIYRQSVLGNLLNPKVSLFFIAFLPQFIRPSEGRIGLQMLLLGLLFMTQTLVIFGTIGWFAGSIGAWLQNSAGAGRKLNLIAALVFFAIALRLALPE